MKVLIDISKDDYDWYTGFVGSGLASSTEKMIANGKVIEDDADITVVNMPDIKQVEPPNPMLDKLTREEWKDIEKKIEPKLHHGDYTLELLDKILSLPEGDSERKYYDSEGLTASSIVSITHVREDVFMVFWRC